VIVKLQEVAVILLFSDLASFSHCTKFTGKFIATNSSLTDCIFVASVATDFYFVTLNATVALETASVTVFHPL